MIQEHAAAKGIATVWKKEMKKEGRTLHLSPTGGKQKGSGVGCLSLDPIKAIPIKGATKRYRQMYEMGLCCIYQMATEGKECYMGNIYGATGGQEKEAAAQKMVAAKKKVNEKKIMQKEKI